MKSESVITYLKVYAIVFIIGFILSGIFNYIVDYENIFRVISIRGFNHEKPLIYDDSLRRVKSLDIEQGNYDTILLGSSRVLMGLDPTHSSLGDRNTYNLGFPLTNIYELEKIYKFSRNKLELKTVILGLDLELFSGLNQVMVDFNKSRFAKQNMILANPDNLFAQYTFRYSLYTIEFNLEGYIANRYTNLGLKNPESSDLTQREKFDRVLANQFFVDSRFYPNFSYDFKQIKLVQKIIEDCRQHHIKLYLFIPPVHARQLEAMRVMGLWSDFEQWKRDLVNLLYEDRQKYSLREPIKLWDFSGYNQFTTEPIPPAGSDREMKWYVESSHYTTNLGDLVLDKLLNASTANEAILENFGVAIDRQNIDSHLQSIQLGHQQYIQNYPDEVAAVEQLARETQNLRNDNRSKSEGLEFLRPSRSPF
jgi:hypothetical protein